MNPVTREELFIDCIINDRQLPEPQTREEEFMIKFAESFKLAKQNADWFENNVNSSSYIENKTHYISPLGGHFSYIETPEINTIQMICDYSKNYRPDDPTNLALYYGADKITKCKGEEGISGVHRIYIKFQMYMMNQWQEEFIFNIVENKIVMLDEYNYLYNIGDFATLYMIINMNSLSEENSKMFSNAGIYMKVLKENKIKNITCGFASYETLSKEYISDELVNYRNIASLNTTDKTITGAINELYNEIQALKTTEAT